MTQQPTRHNSTTGTEASPVERWSCTKDGRRPLLHGNPRSSNSLLERKLQARPLQGNPSPANAETEIASRTVDVDHEVLLTLQRSRRRDNRRVAQGPNVVGKGPT